MPVSAFTKLGRSVGRLIRSTHPGRQFMSWTKRHPDQWNTSKTILLGLGSAVIKPLTFDRAYRHENDSFSPAERKLLYRQEVIRQAVGTGLWLGGMMVSWFVSKRIFKKGKDIAHLANAMLGSTFLDTFVRPIITAKLSVLFKQDEPPKPKAHLETRQIVLPEISHPIVPDHNPPHHPHIEEEAAPGSYYYSPPSVGAYGGNYYAPGWNYYTPSFSRFPTVSGF